MFPNRDVLNGGALSPAGDWAWSNLAALSVLMRQTMLMREWAAPVPHSAPSTITPATPQRTPSSAMMVAVIPLGECG
jgi:hypothetical protein